jgi:hypothetical protein
MFILIGFLITFILVLSYICLNLYFKIDVLYKRIDELNDIEQNSFILLNSLVVKYTNILTRLKRIDRLGSFESDDEVGFVFKTIKQTIETLVSELKEISKEQNTTDGDRKN